MLNCNEYMVQSVIFGVPGIVIDVLIVSTIDDIFTVNVELDSQYVGL
jgi:hypothetical protein